MKYSDKLKNPKWQKRRLSVMSRDGFRCRTCGDAETTLAVHHLMYSGEPWDAPEAALLTLCSHCHELIESRFNEAILINEPFIKIKNGNLILLAVFTHEKIELYGFAPQLSHIISVTHKNLKLLVHFIINHWIKNDHDLNLIDYEIPKRILST